MGTLAPAPGAVRRADKTYCHSYKPIVGEPAQENILNFDDVLRNCAILSICRLKSALAMMSLLGPVPSVQWIDGLSSGVARIPSLMCVSIRRNTKAAV
jgi:hypothetical protein